MASAKKNGGSGSDEVVRIPREIWKEMKVLNGRIDRTRDELGGRLPRKRSVVV